MLNGTRKSLDQSALVEASDCRPRKRGSAGRLDEVEVGCDIACGAP